MGGKGNGALWDEREDGQRAMKMRCRQDLEKEQKGRLSTQPDDGEAGR